MSEAIIAALLLAVLGMGIVLFVLFVLNLILMGMGIVFGEKKKAAPVPAAATAAPAPAAPAAPAEDDGEVMAVITAAINAYLAGSSSQLVVRPYLTSAPEGGWTVAAKTQILK